MCGIAGIVARRKVMPLDGLIRDMTERVRHRGPDGAGCHIDGRVALGHRRLAIIDLSPLGHQPMHYAGDRYTITYNGEIYNYLELRRELADLGCVFRSHSDTEVILAAYATWGVHCLDRFNGMWAFAIHDRERSLVFAARDRFGVKPFYHVMTEQYFAFGSEISQLLPLLPAVRANATVVSDYLLTGVQTQSTDTFFDQVSALLPGHYLEYTLGTDTYSVTRFYDLKERVNVQTPASSDACALSKTHDLIEDAVRLRLRSDVRVGTCLSGGVDSSTIALIAAGMYRGASANAFSAITAISEDPENSEEDYAAEIVRKADLDWVRVQPDYEAFRALLPTVIRHQEEPFQTPSICMQAFVMQAARENGIIVLLDGQGADETFLGYDKYYPAYALAQWQQGGPLAMLAGMRAAMRNNVNMSPQRLAAYCALLLLPVLRRQYYRSCNSYVRSTAFPEWITKFAISCRDFRQLQVLEIESTMLPSLLRFEDKNSMAFGIETRLPFLDYRLVEHALAMRPELKIHDGWTKWGLRQAVNDVLPPNIGWRRRKIGFEAPTTKWLSRHQDVMTEAVRESALLARFCKMSRLLPLFPRLDPNHQWRLYGLAAWEAAFSVRV